MTQPSYRWSGAIYEGEQHDTTHTSVLPENRQSPSMQALNASVRPSPSPSHDTLPGILETLVGENRRLHSQLRENNTVLDLKIKELQDCLEAKERDQSLLQKEVSEATNNFFEARVAVLGFKCRLLQLQGQLETAQGNETRAQKTEDETKKWLQEIERLNRRIQQLEEEKEEIQAEGTSELMSARNEVHRIRQEKEQSVKALEDRLKQETRPSGVLQQKMEVLSRQLDARNTAYDELKQKYQQLQERQAEAAETQQQVKGVTPVPKPRTQRADLQQRIDQLEREKEEQEQKLADAVKARAAADRILASAHEREETLRQDNMTLKGLLEKHQQEVLSLKADLRVQRSQSEGGQGVSHVDLSAQDLRRPLSWSPDVLRELERLREENSTLKTKAEELKLSNGQQQEAIKQESQLMKLEREIAERKDENDRVLDEVEILKVRLAGSEADRQALMRQREALESELKSQKAMVSKLTMAAKQREEAEVVVKEYEKECTKLITDLDSTDGKLKKAVEEQERLQQQVDGYKRELAQRVERIQRLEATRDDLLEQVTFQQLQLKQNRQDIQCEVKLREEAETLKKTLERRNADQKNEISELKAMISRLQQEPMTEPQPMDVMYTSARRPLELSYESHRQGGLEYVVGMGPPERIVGMGPERVPGMGPERVPGMGPERVPGMGPERVPGMGPERGTGMGLERMVGIPYSAQPPRTGYNQPNAGGPYTRERLVQPQEEHLVRPYRPPSEATDGRFQPQPQPYSHFSAPQPVAPCPICGRNDFITVADLEHHSSHCTDFK